MAGGTFALRLRGNQLTGSLPLSLSYLALEVSHCYEHQGHSSNLSSLGMAPSLQLMSYADSLRECLLTLAAVAT